MDARWWAVVVLAVLPSLGAGGETPEAPPESWTRLWFFRFLVNAAGYASFMVPGYLLVQYFRRKNYLETGRGLCFPLVKICVFGNEPKASDEVPLAPRTEPVETTPTWQVLKLLFCATGLQVGRKALFLFCGSWWAWTPWSLSFHPTSPNSLLVGVLCVPTSHGHTLPPS